MEDKTGKSAENAFFRRIKRKFSHNSLKRQSLDIFGKQMGRFNELMAYYRCAMMEVETKFDVLNEELSLEYDRNPIESIKTRLKSLENIMEKLDRKGYDINFDNMEKYINDVAGVRVVCSFPKDVYMLADCLLRQDDITLIEKKDYIKNPKESGYRSLHLIIEIPIFLHDQKKKMKVEIQLRTIAMDFWASLEHKIRYKKDINDIDTISHSLKECAELSAQLDVMMDNIRRKIE